MAAEISNWHHTERQLGILEFVKIGITNRAEAVAIALRKHLLKI